MSHTRPEKVVNGEIKPAGVQLPVSQELVALKRSRNLKRSQTAGGRDMGSARSTLPMQRKVTG